MLRSGGGGVVGRVLLLRRATAAASTPQRLTVGFSGNGRPRRLPLPLQPPPRRRLSQQPPSQPREGAAPAAEVEAAEAAVPPPLPEVPVVEAPAGELFEPLRESPVSGLGHAIPPVCDPRLNWIDRSTNPSIHHTPHTRRLGVLPGGRHRAGHRDGLRGGQLDGQGPERLLAQRQARVRFASSTNLTTNPLRTRRQSPKLSSRSSATTHRPIHPTTTPPQSIEDTRP